MSAGPPGAPDARGGQADAAAAVDGAVSGAVSGVDAVLDARGQRCPLPVVALSRAAAASPGAVLQLLATDPAARHDVPAWCRMRGAQLLAAEEAADEGDGVWRFTVRAAAGPPAR